MPSAIVDLLSGLASAISGGYQWSLAKLGLNNRPAMKDNAIGARDEATKEKVEADFQNADPTKFEEDINP